MFQVTNWEILLSQASISSKKDIKWFCERFFSKNCSKFLVSRSYFYVKYSNEDNIFVR